jgi:hypothetical protein
MCINYNAYGQVLHRFLHNDTAITHDSSPLAYYELTALDHIACGWKLLQEWILACNPHMSVTCHDCRALIHQLLSLANELIVTYYHHVYKVSREITLSHNATGMQHELLLHFVQTFDGSTVLAQGYGMVVIHLPGSEHMLALWPSYYYPEVPHNTFSLNAIKHYLLLPSVITEHTHHLTITLHSSISLQFPSLPSVVESSGLDFFNIEIIHPPPSSSQSSAVLHPIVRYANGPSLSRALIHQRFGHISDDVIDERERESYVQYCAQNGPDGPGRRRKNEGRATEPCRRTPARGQSWQLSENTHWGETGTITRPRAVEASPVRVRPRRSG